MIFTVDCEAEGKFTCGNGGCINSSQVCNGEDNCHDLSDERGCSRSHVRYLQWVVRLRECSSVTMVGLSTHLKCVMVKITVLTSQMKEIVVGPMFDIFSGL